jgi:hypothetical protein
MSTNRDAQPWTIRSTLVAVTDLNRSIEFYSELGPFGLIDRQDAVAVVGLPTPSSIVLILRQTRDLHQVRHGQQSLGLRSITFNVGSLGELDRIESFLRSRSHFTSRRQIAEGAAELLWGRDPDNLPLVFIRYEGDSVGPDYFRAIVNLVYSLDA